MTVEALIFVRAASGKTRDVISRLAAGKKSYDIKGMKKVFRTSGEYDAIAYVSAKDPEGIFSIADSIRNFNGGRKETSPLVLVTNVYILVPKQMGDP